MATIVIDPGHGGTENISGDSSANNATGPGGTKEKDLALIIGKLSAEILTGKGHSVHLTRTDDINIKLSDRAGVAKTKKADVFLSIHLNASDQHNAQGTETLVNTNHSAASASLSLCVQDAVLSATGLKDRNKSFNPDTRIKTQNLGVLRPERHDPRTAAALLEISFLDQADEEKRLNTPQYRAEVASAIADGIENYLRQPHP
jgi:N-acetylmuramoyl-L-alanine amidase